MKKLAITLMCVITLAFSIDVAMAADRSEMEAKQLKWLQLVMQSKLIQPAQPNAASLPNTKPVVQDFIRSNVNLALAKLILGEDAVSSKVVMTSLFGKGTTVTIYYARNGRPIGATAVSRSLELDGKQWFKFDADGQPQLYGVLVRAPEVEVPAAVAVLGTIVSSGEYFVPVAVPVVEGAPNVTYFFDSKGNFVGYHTSGGSDSVPTDEWYAIDPTVLSQPLSLYLKQRLATPIELSTASDILGVAIARGVVNYPPSGMAGAAIITKFYDAEGRLVGQHSVNGSLGPDPMADAWYKVDQNGALVLYATASYASAQEIEAAVAVLGRSVASGKTITLVNGPAGTPRTTNFYDVEGRLAGRHRVGGFGPEPLDEWYAVSASLLGPGGAPVVYLKQRMANIDERAEAVSVLGLDIQSGIVRFPDPGMLDAPSVYTFFDGNGAPVGKHIIGGYLPPDAPEWFVMGDDGEWVPFTGLVEDETGKTGVAVPGSPVSEELLARAKEILGDEVVSGYHLTAPESMIVEGGAARFFDSNGNLVGQYQWDPIHIGGSQWLKVDGSGKLVLVAEEPLIPGGEPVPEPAVVTGDNELPARLAVQTAQDEVQGDGVNYTYSDQIAEPQTQTLELQKKR